MIKTKLQKGKRYLLIESNCIPPLNSTTLEFLTEKTYRYISAYYYNKGNKVKARNYSDRGLKYVPNGNFPPP